MKIEELQKFIKENKIPKIKGKPKTFLGIAKQPHYENVLSNIYAFYFNVNEVHKLYDLFIVSLQELIAKKLIDTDLTKDISFSEGFEIETEYTTKKGGRIDLLLTSENEAIIIENKVYHLLNNDLKDYWNSIDGLVTKKIGIVLSLNPILEIKHKHFINITHLELFNSVMSNLGNYLLEANDKYLVFLKDLYQNITNLSKSFMEKKDLEFYFKNKEEINQIVEFKDTVLDHVISELRIVGDSIEDVDTNIPRRSSDAGKRYCYLKSKINSNLMITIVFRDLLLKDEMYIVVEFKGAALKNKAQYNVVEFTAEEKEILVEGFENSTNNYWAHFAIKRYDLKQDEILNLSDFISRALKDDYLLAVYRKLNEYMLVQKKEKELVG
ncbi:hypothetical protein BTO15_15705 [Polaribacter sejongensis]|uniref:PD-(D/E)XK nuclease superfamily protein n=1 Tax=Polaribacter sejongensis TaxID=985043 RepID=A0ABN5F7H8_9FLAO|nr:PD-(D/E)XK nuclease family protein [Polaribacter sejongensis]AUC23458.1 hypothetical protein BTO15_15705 [Polaribacter sejongensis]